MWQDQVNAALDQMRSRHSNVSDAELDMSNPKFATCVGKAFSWGHNPHGIMILSGNYGCGKSHILQAIDEMLAPIALYITASDFEQKIFEHMGDNTLSTFVKGMSLAPILLFDDLGMEYGSPIVQSQMIHLIDSRYRNLDLFPMALATNYDSTTLMYMDRIGSRLMQESTLTWVSFAGVPDYRIRRAK
jgi:DNA replication protein DnaC